MTNLEERATKLAARPYSIEILHDETTSGEPIIVVSHPELPGCMAQGNTLEEAQAELAEARKEYILSLLEDELPVPGPLEQKIGATTMTTGTRGGISQSSVITVSPTTESLDRDSDDDSYSKPITVSVVKG